MRFQLQFTWAGEPQPFISQGLLISRRTQESFGGDDNQQSVSHGTSRSSLDPVVMGSNELITTHYIQHTIINAHYYYPIVMGSNELIITHYLQHTITTYYITS